MCLRILLVTPSIPQSQFSEKGFKKTENVQHSLVLLGFFLFFCFFLFNLLFTVEINNLSGPKFCKVQSKVSYLTFSTAESNRCGHKTQGNAYLRKPVLKYTISVTC